ncbi:MAG: hypothetical protein JNL02_03305 [Saprospiraceae bacterium]|nr:hypothetical protein [Saprospiraceae bacterium]
MENVARNLFFPNFVQIFVMSAALNNAQLEILQLFAADLSPEELAELRRILIEFRYRRLQKAINHLDLSEGAMEEWQKGHERTPYAAQKQSNK